MDGIGAVATATAGSAASARSTIEEAQDRFIKLLVAQLQNQDPMSPLDNAQLTTQLAQISTVQGLEKLNGSVGELLGAINAGRQLQGASLLGRDVLVEGDALTLSGGRATGGLWLESAADTVRVSIVDAEGVVVRTLDLGAQPAGSGTFEWDGKDGNGQSLPAGTYRIRLEATSGESAVTTRPMSVGRISSVAFEGANVLLVVNGRTIGLGEIGRII